ncbi:hypothetical protein [Pelagicoccus sp. SDUM812005]|uniref:hypothetical protein n=1 Tax=Pelagicoccus sp. SDUM812005 TaxID=3041257 RepID=UPI00280F494D|nr:hypothetical protein [Pelagicoccus sp. SDUM812005]MDQ8180102.1 hypothetical protein [Pelagicoccus sp. SDUM812005]
MSDQSPDYPLLVLDTSSRTTWVGLKLSARELISRSEEQDPSKTLFKLADAVLAEAGKSLSELASIAFCAGPGSMLGARTASMAIRAWKGIGIPAAQSVFYYNSLQIGALIAAEQLDSRGLVVTDARRAAWNALPFPLDPASELSLIANEELESREGTIASFAEFPSWTKTAARLTELSYDPSPIFQQEAFLPLLSPTREASPLTVRSNEYKKWDAKIHSAREA